MSSSHNWQKHIFAFCAKIKLVKCKNSFFSFAFLCVFIYSNKKEKITNATDNQFDS